MMRTRYCGLFRPEHVGERAAVAGGVDAVRDRGGVVFLDVRDREGVMLSLIHIFCSLFLPRNTRVSIGSRKGSIEGLSLIHIFARGQIRHTAR